MEVGLQASDTEEVNFSILLEDDDLRSRQLGSSQIGRNKEQHMDAPRQEVTAIETGSFNVSVRCQRPRYGLAKNDKGEDVLATLIRFDLSFQQLSKRLRRAEVEIEFEDASTLDLNAHEVQISSVDEPTILRIAPRLYQGTITQVIGHRSRELGMSISDPSQVAGVRAKLADTTPTVKEGSFTIHGRVKRSPASEVHWVLREDKIKKTGLFPEVSVGILVSCTPGRKFAARVRVTADIWLNFLKLVAGKKDDPLFFTPPMDFGQNELDKKLDEIDQMDYESGRHIRTIE
ncbi:hypothetical protein MMC10_006215 [Thelotrema lepadinum]|nr:hypothetical protein [Thelotrema lepadinum]